MSPVAWLGAFWIGIILGLFGSGGSIVTVPLLVYVVHQTEKVAIAGSLGIVGSIAFVGGAVAAVRKRVDWRSVMFFGPAGMVGTYGGVWLASFVSGGVQLLVFAVVMALAASFMLRAPANTAPRPRLEQPVATLACQGLAVGSLTGFVGVGGGFLIVPALSLLGGLPMHVAIGTSLVVITLTSVVGFVRHLEVLGRAGMSVDWTIIAAFATAGVVGSLAGQIAGGRIPQARLRRMFAVFLLVAGAYITYRTLPQVLGVSIHSIIDLSFPFGRGVSSVHDSRTTLCVRCSLAPLAVCGRQAWGDDPLRIELLDLVERRVAHQAVLHNQVGLLTETIGNPTPEEIAFVPDQVGPEITFRAQPHGTFKFLFNAIYYGTSQIVGSAHEHDTGNAGR